MAAFAGMARTPAPAAKYRDELIATAKQVATPGKGILASDESPGTCKKRFDSINKECTEETRRQYRELLYSTPGLEESISGVIMHEETFKQSTSSGQSFVEYLRSKGIAVGIKVDTGLKDFPGSTTGEQWTSGLDDLAARAAKFYEAGARFAKWRNVLKISKDGNPTDAAILDCTMTLAKYAVICQANGLVPIVEPEIMLDGDHDLETAQRIHEKVWRRQYDMCATYGMLLEGSLFKPSMIVPGADLPKAKAAEVAKVTIDTLRKTVPAAMTGITFLSGGQSEQEASEHLNEMNKCGTCPWNVSFSFGRALQASVLKAWQGKEENVKAAQDMLKALSDVNGLAAKGAYNATKGHPSASGSLYVKDYVY